VNDYSLVSRRLQAGKKREQDSVKKTSKQKRKRKKGKRILSFSLPAFMEKRERRASFGMTDGTFLFLVLFFFGWPKKKTNKQAARQSK
jgi:hypothetical protein